jgi:flavin reductase (DIM6/NTAB) family NADH-FMN oxidoreductase RutF
MHKLEPSELTIRPFHLLDEEWALLVGGAERPNPMTVSWGGFGTLWNRPVVTVYVRPTRFTYGLIEARPEFTLNFLPEAYRPALDLCGSVSGRDTDKWKAAGLEPVPSERIAVPRVAGAALSLECRVLSAIDVDPGRFLDPTLERLYPERDYHRAFLGEVLVVWRAQPPERG